MSVVQVLVLAIVAILVNQLKNGRSLALLGVSSAGWMWILLYAYSLRIYFDFSGYTILLVTLSRVKFLFCL